MSGNDSAVNWEAYSHSELHRMLWQDADVGAVSRVAVGWTEHRAALATHAEVLREQRAALLADWQGVAAEEAAARLAALADRVEKISELAGAGQRAAQDAADALAAARAAMPPPPAGLPGVEEAPGWRGAFGAPPAGEVPVRSSAGWLTGTDAVSPSGFTFGTPPSSFGPSAFASAPFSLPSAPAFTPQLPQFPQGGGTGISFFFTIGSADQQKAQAVRTMQTYESSLNGGSRLIDDARGAVPQPAATPNAPVPPRAGQKPAAGVPWQRLAGGGPVARSAGVPVASGPVQQQLTPGVRTGVLLGVAGGPAPVAAPVGEPNARGAAQNGGMAPPASGARGEDEQEHQNRMPTLDHGLFELDERACPPVIGVEA